MFKIPALLKTTRFWILFLVTALLFQVLGDWLSERDEFLRESKSWLRSQSQVTAVVGEIRRIDVQESIYYKGDNELAPYNRYRLLLDGNLNDAVAVVKVNRSGIADGQIELLSLQPLN